jgi:hypothetical protein
MVMGRGAGQQGLNYRIVVPMVRACVVLCDSSETECACVVCDLSETVSVCGLIVVTLCVHLVTVIVNHFIMELMHQ